MTKRSDVEALVRAAIDKHGRVDVIVNNAGDSGSSVARAVAYAIDQPDVVDTNEIVIRRRRRKSSEVPATRIRP